MGFITSLFLLSLFGFFSHFLYRKYGLEKGHPAWIFYYGTIILSLFIIIDILLYIGLFNFIFNYLNYIPWIDIKNGKDLMWNSLLVFGIDFNIDSAIQNLDSVAVILFLSYPMWYLFFQNLSRKWYGGNRNRPYERGLNYLFED